MEIQQFQFEDDGKIPNSVFPLVLYKKAFPFPDYMDEVMEEAFAKNNWTNAWRNGVYDYHHYHSITHEVLGIYKGSAELQFGGDKGEQVSVTAGDVVLIPAGTGHKKISSTDDFAVLGAYPDGMEYDLMKGKKEERPAADDRIAKVPFPDNDPLLGDQGGIIEFWK